MQTNVTINHASALKGTFLGTAVGTKGLVPLICYRQMKGT